MTIYIAKTTVSKNKLYHILRMWVYQCVIVEARMFYNTL